MKLETTRISECLKGRHGNRDILKRTHGWTQKIIPKRIQLVAKHHQDALEVVVI